ncbi:ABC transporter permease [Magnetovibrio blakemorei]|uniref:ABC transporter permease n=1 Tax=Magnetovibrio blakemorei TaxID=28181 RepID=A0A1E5Q5Z3_9PROT|nr:ABC transporter permease [Magnetovibrio blakemorei]OEJ65677.1 ABC transporter permease [Magnetovibrio blakemorei]
MSEITTAFGTAISLIFSINSELAQIVGLSLYVSICAVLIATILGVPLGASVALLRFPGRGPVQVILNALMGLPPVVVGLIVYLILSRSGPLGVFGLLYTPTAMIIAQVILVTPIIAALSRQVIEDLWAEYAEQLTSLGASPLRAMPTLIMDGRFRLFTAVLAGFGRATAEVGAVMMVGGNIDHVTRVMTTTIALEVSKGDLALALALGIVLLSISITIGALAQLIKDRRQMKGRA